MIALAKCWDVSIFVILYSNFNLRCEFTLSLQCFILHKFAIVFTDFTFYTK